MENSIIRSVTVPTPRPAVTVPTPRPAVTVPKPRPAVTVPTPRPAVTVPTPRPDSADLSATAISENSQSKALNPFEGIAERFTTVTPEKWSPSTTLKDGQVAKNDNLFGILRNQGFSSSELNAKDSTGKPLYARISDIMGLDNPNLIRSDRSYKVPTRLDP